MTKKTNMITMTAVKKHVISSKDNTPIYSMEDLSQISALIPKGNWLGILEKKENLLKVISTQGSGWIRMDDIEETNKYKLRVFRDSRGEIQYGVV
jgi:hypothetical protein